jgi:carbon monoxide dehydrogenase subunit G
MQFEKTARVKASLKEVWDFMWEHEKLCTCVKGCEKVEVVEPEHKYTAFVGDKVGPFKVHFALEIEVLEVEELKHIVAKATGKDSKIAARVRQNMDLNLVEVGDRETELRFKTEVSIFGKLATLGHWIIKRKADEAMEFFVRGISAQLEKEGGH